MLEGVEVLEKLEMLEVLEKLEMLELLERLAQSRQPLISNVYFLIQM